MDQPVSVLIEGRHDAGLVIAVSNPLAPGPAYPICRGRERAWWADRARAAGGGTSRPRSDDGAGVPPSRQAGMAGMSGPIRVLVVDDDASVRAALVMMLDGADGITVVGEANDGHRFPDAVEASSPT